MATPIDQTGDLTGRELFRLAQVYNAPEYVKSASEADLCGEGLPRECYADPLRRHYPLATKAAVWASAAFFHDQGRDEDPGTADILDRIKEMARVHGIETDVDAIKEAKYRRKAASALPETKDPADYAYAFAGELRYPLRHTQEVKTAAAYFVENRTAFDFEARNRFAKAVLSKAAQFGASLTKQEQDVLEKSAGIGLAPSADVVDFLDERCRSVRPNTDTAGIHEEMRKLAADCQASPSALRDTEVRLKLAATIDLFDRACGLDVAYADGLPIPEDVLFAVTKTAATSLSATLAEAPSGNVYETDEFTKVSGAEVGAVFGQKVLEQLSRDAFTIDPEKTAAWLAKASPADGDMFEALCKEAGVYPALKPEPKSKTADYWKKMAATFKPSRPANTKPKPGLMSIFKS